MAHANDLVPCNNTAVTLHNNLTLKAFFLNMINECKNIFSVICAHQPYYSYRGLLGGMSEMLDQLTNYDVMYSL